MSNAKSDSKSIGREIMNDESSARQFIKKIIELGKKDSKLSIIQINNKNYEVRELG